MKMPEKSYNTHSGQGEEVQQVQMPVVIFR